jgi:predicted enzyme related to lactoylglutathione lyase
MSLDVFSRLKKRDDPHTHGKEASVNLNSVMIGSEEPRRLADYYAKLFGKPAMEEGDFHSWQIGTGWVTVVAHDQVKGKNAHPGRVIWNIETPDVKSEFDRMMGAGATVVQEPYRPEGAPEGALVATFSDPDDNYFQLVSPM